MSGSVISSIIAKLGVSTFVGFIIYLLGAPNITAFTAVIVLCGLDLATAMFILVKKRGRFQSSKFLKKLFGLTKYAIVVMAFNMLTIIHPSFAFLVDAAIVWCGLSEITSILEHMTTLGMKINLPILKDLAKDIDQNGQNGQNG